MKQPSAHRSSSGGRRQSLDEATKPSFPARFGAFAAIASMNLLIIMLVALTSIEDTGYRESLCLGIAGAASLLVIYGVITTDTPSVPKKRKLGLVAKRLLDLTYASIVLTLTLPLWSLVAVAIALDSRGPVLYRSLRLGQYGELFGAFRFRTMSVDGSGVTRVGEFLRRTSLDMLPSVYNVIEGEMSIVGPYPRLPGESTSLTQDAEAILGFKPGLTSLAAVTMMPEALDSQPHRWIALDLEYVNNWSLLLDAKILLLTVLVMLRRRE